MFKTNFNLVFNLVCFFVYFPRNRRQKRLFDKTIGYLIVFMLGIIGKKNKQAVCLCLWAQNPFDNRQTPNLLYSSHIS